MTESILGIPPEAEQEMWRELHRRIGRRPQPRIWRQLAESGLLQWAYDHKESQLGSWLDDLVGLPRARRRQADVTGDRAPT